MRLFFPITACLFLLSAMGMDNIGKSPEPFAVLDLEAGRTFIPETIVQETDYFEAIPEDERKGKPFLVSSVDYHTLKMHENVTAESPFLTKSLNVFSPSGEYVLRTFSFRSYVALPDVAFRVSCLTGASGGSIENENIRVFRIARLKENYSNANLLLAPEMKNAGKNTLAFFALLINIPVSAKPGIYRGKIEVAAGNAEQKLDLNCRVMNLSLPAPDAVFGSFMPYFPYDITPVIPSRRRALPCYTSANQENYFRFCRTRGFNSQTLCEFDLKLKEKGNNVLDFSELDRQIKLLTKTGQDKAVVLDCRCLNLKAEELAKQACFQKVGKDAVALYKEMAGQLVKHAQEKNYPHFLLFAEEEAGNGGIKLAHYGKFGKILQQIAGQEHSIVVDLEVGPGRNNAVDRGSVDGYKYRQYNNWTEETLAKAHLDGAVVWSYNYGGFGRPAFGFIQQRLGSLGFHQWADQWGEDWTYNVPTPLGVVSSLRFESSHEGIVDYRYVQALKKVDPKLAAELISPIPVPREDAQFYFLSRSLEEFDLLRWRAALRLDPSFVPEPVSGSPELRITPVKILSPIQNKDLSLTAVRVNNEYQIEASGRFAGWTDNCTGSLRYTLSKEKKLRGSSADMEQIKKLLTPSYCESFVSFNDKGLILFSRVNHTKYGESSLRENNDPDLWKDNCLEFFFRPPGGAKYQFIVNSSGKKVFLRNNSVVDASSIQCILVERKGDAGGYLQEALIPWLYFDRASRPSDGEIWAFNAAREFHTWNQLTQWAASDGFWDDSRWGSLKFSWKKSGEYLMNVSLPDFCRPGKNCLEGSIPGTKPLQIVLSDGDGKETARKTLSGSDRKFRFEVEISADERIPRRLSVLEGDNVLEYESIPVRDFSSAFSSNKAELECWTGGTVSFTLNANFSQYRIPSDAAVLAILDSRNREVASFSLHIMCKSAVVCWLKTDGLAPGNYTIEPVLKNPLAGVFKSQCKVKLTVYPAPALNR